MFGPDRHDHPALGFAEQPGIFPDGCLGPDIKAQTTGHGAFEQRSENAAVRYVVYRRCYFLPNGCLDHPLDKNLLFQLEVRTRAIFHATHGAQVFAAAQVIPARTDQADQIARIFEIQRHHLVGTIQQTQHPDGWGRVDRHHLIPYGVLVIKTHVPARHRGAEATTGFAHAANGLGKLGVHFGVVGIAKIQTIGDRHRFAAGTDDVAGGFGHGNHRSAIRIGVHVGRVTVGGQRQGLLGAFYVHNGSVGGAVGGHCAGAHHGVVLLGDPVFGGQVGRMP